MLRSLSCLVVVAVHLVCSGCAAPIAISATAGLAAAQLGTEAWVAGELRMTKFVDLNTTYEAVKRAMDDLEVNILTDRLGERSAFIMAKDSGGPEIRVSLRRRTPKLTRIGIRVGIIGELSTSRAVILRIRTHLPEGAGAVIIEE